VLDADRFAEILKVVPSLYHVTRATNVASIKVEGLRPGSEIELSTRDDFFSTRPGHVYLLGREDVPIVEVEGEPAVFAVDLATLDPALIDPDEDMVQQRFPEMVSVTPPRRALTPDGAEAPGQGGALARWAERTPGFDRSEVTERSLSEHRRLAYRGVIAAQALTLVSIPSTALQAFRVALPPPIAIALPQSPPWGGWRIEVTRARALVAGCVRSALQALGSDIEIQTADPDLARTDAARLGEAARRTRRAGDLHGGTVLSAAQAALEPVGELEGLDPVVDEGYGAEAARAAAQVVGLLSRLTAGEDGARQVAVEAFGATLSGSRPSRAVEGRSPTTPQQPTEGHGATAATDGGSDDTRRSW
jgi:hypothetical protein